MKSSNILKQYPDFRNFFCGQLISQLGDRIHSLALLWITYKWSGSAALVGGIMVGTSLPGILIAPYAGTIIDRCNKKQVMIAADAARFFILAFVTFTSYQGRLDYPLLLGATVLISLASAFFNPAALAVMPELVEEKQEILTSANALAQIGASASAVAGPVVGSALIAAIGVSAAFLCNTISFTVSIWFLLKIKTRLQTNAIHESWLKDIRVVKVVFARIPLLAQLLFPVLLVNLFFCSISIIIPVLAEGVYKMGANGMGWMMAAFGGGMLISTLVLSFYGIRGSERGVVASGFFLLGTAFLVIGALPSYPLSLAGCLLAGLSLSVVNIKLIVLYQRLLPVESRGKVMAVVTALALSTQPVSYGLTGYVLDLVEPLRLMLICGAAIVPISIYVFFLKGWRTCNLSE